jgi:hypothetical protein
VKSQLDQDRGRRYNSQFNPEYINKKKINWVQFETFCSISMQIFQFSVVK